MRLINVETFKLEEFHHNIPPYAVLSHTWGDEEVTFEMYQEYLKVTNRCLCPGTNARDNNIELTASFAKIMGACKRAREDKLGYLWCDTNCIDKSSSAELTEAINSMYAWYRDSAVCYAYLADVGVFDRAGRGTEEFRKTRWFTRGWTLQELLAPEKLVFFNKNWTPIADRQQLAEIIRGVTGIHIGALENRGSIPTYSIAQRMSWAAHRQTSRQEDIAYCLLGIFGINMPLLYGEGIKAFSRLQEEIIKVSDDQSIFAWDCSGCKKSEFASMLASSPGNFASCGSIVREINLTGRPYSVSNIGLSLQLPMIQSVERGSVLVGLNCSVELHDYRPRGASQAAKVQFCRLPVWIWLNLIHDNIYRRSSFPVSRTLLPAFYHAGVECSVINLFGITSQPPWLSSQELMAPPSGYGRTTSTGFYVTIGFGRIEPETGILEEAFSPRSYEVTRLAPRGSPALSHEIITAGNYIVLLSMVWDHQQQLPIYWHHHSFVGVSNIHRLACNNWDMLFRTRLGSFSDGSDSTGRIAYIHNQIQAHLAQPGQVVNHDKAPFVCFEKNLCQDQHEQPTVLAHLTFQEARISRLITHDRKTD